MKRIFTSFLMLLAMIIVSTVSFAQNGGGNYAASGLQDGNRMINMHSKVFTGNVQPTLKSGSDIMAKNKRIKTASGDLWYAKPEGTFYKNTFPSASLVVPPFTTLTFENKSTQIESTSWSLNGETISNGTSSYQSEYPALRETAYFPAPQLSIGKDTFALGITGAKGEVACQIATKETVDNLSKTDYVVGIQDMGAAGLTSSSFEMAGRSGSGMKMHLDRVPMRESGMTPYELMLSESQERMLICAKKGCEDKIKEIFAKWDLDAEVIGEVTNTQHI